MLSETYNIATVVQKPLPQGQQSTAGQSKEAAQEGGVAPNQANVPKDAVAQTLIARSVNALSEGEAAGDQGEASKEQVDHAVERINAMMDKGQSRLKFEVNEEAGRMVVQVLDMETEEVIRQIPSEETLKFAEYVEGLVGLIFDEQA